MADTLNFLQNGYNGEVLEDLLTYTVQGNDTVREGLIHIKTGIQHRYTLPAVNSGTSFRTTFPLRSRRMAPREKTARTNTSLPSAISNLPTL